MGLSRIKDIPGPLPEKAVKHWNIAELVNFKEWADRYLPQLDEWHQKVTLEIDKRNNEACEYWGFKRMPFGE